MKFREDIASRLTARHIACLKFAGKLDYHIILDIGCWIGWCERLITSNSTIGLDINPKTLNIAKKNNPSCDFVCASAYSLPFKDSIFQDVLIFDTIEHIPKDSEKTFFREANRVLNSDGKIIISTYNNNLRSILFDPAFFLGHRHYSIERLQHLLNSNGFEAYGVENGGGWVEGFSMILFYAFKHFFNREIPFKTWCEKRREKEYHGKGFMSIFVKAVKP